MAWRRTGGERKKNQDILQEITSIFDCSSQHPSDLLLPPLFFFFKFYFIFKLYITVLVFVLWLSLVLGWLKPQAQALFKVMEGVDEGQGNSLSSSSAQLQIPRSCQQQGHSQAGSCSSLYFPKFLQASVPPLCPFIMLYKSRSQASRESPAKGKSGLKRERD